MVRFPGADGTSSEEVALPSSVSRPTAAVRRSRNALADVETVAVLHDHQVLTTVTSGRMGRPSGRHVGGIVRVPVSG
jgi:hypothetical protein